MDETTCTVNRTRVGDIEIAYRWDGPDDAPVVMMAHAMGTSHRLWDWQVPALSSAYRLLRYDWRGHGDTDAPEGPYTLAEFEADAVGLMDALGLDRVHWVGISTGGMIGQGLAINHAERLLSITLCNTTSQSNAWYRDWVAERQAPPMRPFARSSSRPRFPATWAAPPPSPSSPIWTTCTGSPARPGSSPPATIRRRPWRARSRCGSALGVPS
jgi:pimeloyl-ACP methyl ester carboxylesterase